MVVNVIHDEPKKRFVAKVENGEAELTYEQSSAKVIDFVRTFVPEEDREKGIATKLVKQALEIVKKEDLKVKASCPFVKEYLAEHTDQYEDIMV